MAHPAWMRAYNKGAKKKRKSGGRRRKGGWFKFRFFGFRLF